MKLWRILILWLVLAVVLLTPGEALAQTYLFSLDQLTVHVYWQPDGTASLAYEFIFTNNPSASPIDYVDVGLPNGDFDVNTIDADVDGKQITDISRSGYQGSGTGVALGLGPNAIRPGQTSRVHVYVGNIRNMVYQDSEGDNYASGVFDTTWFGSEFVTGATDMMVIFHLPPGVQPDEPRWHAAPGGWPSEPQTGLDEEGRVTYTWANPDARGYIQYEFGASFPAQYIPESAIAKPGLMERLGINPDDFIGVLFCCGIGGFMIFSTVISFYSTKKRKMQYLSPKIAIEGHGIKRGLTAIEAAILLEQPMDKILTMILFSTIKKNAAEVIQKEPLKIKQISPLPEGLQEYEIEFLKAFEGDARKQRKSLQDLMINLVKSVSNKMKGFSRKETIEYYKNITERAWAQVEAANTPEVKSEKYDEVMEWTMLDKKYEDRTRDTFSGGPIFVPTWWGRFDPGYGRSVATGGSVRPVSAPSSSGSGGQSISMPSLPGSAFAASIVNGVQNFSSSVVGNLTDFTSGVTTRTNPIPVSSSRPSGGFRGGGGGGCACACACAGCACACAGGGR